MGEVVEEESKKRARSGGDVKDIPAIADIKHEVTGSPSSLESNKKPRKKKSAPSSGTPNSTPANDPNDDGRDESGLFRVGSRIFCKYNGDGTFRLCQVIDARKNADGSEKYYVHFVEFNRRMDSWIKGVDASKDHPDGDQHRSNVVEFVEEDYGESNGMDEASIREHEEITKIKNVDKIELGRNVITTWYFSPVPKEFTPNGSVDLLYMSEFTLDLFRTSDDLARHYRRCKIWHPPGDEIYRDEVAKVSFWEVDGSKSKIYAQNLCYLAKLFLDHKTLHYDVDPFLFYLLCEFDDKGYHLVGYFSKEKYSEMGNNLACILTLPPYQRKGFGNLLISFSYELSKKEKKIGSPEKPLSDLGQLSYRTYWSIAMLEAMLKMPGDSISIIEITAITSIKTEDVILALKFLGLIKYVHGNHVVCADPELLKQKLKGFKQKGTKIDPEKLHWAPLKVDVKRDKWSIKSKRKPDSRESIA